MLHVLSQAHRARYGGAETPSAVSAHAEGLLVVNIRYIRYFYLVAALVKVKLTSSHLELLSMTER